MKQDNIKLVELYKAATAKNTRTLKDVLDEPGLQ